MSSMEAFVSEHPELLSDLRPASREAFARIGAAIAHLRSRQSRAFYIQTLGLIQKTESHPFCDQILAGAEALSRSNWALIPHFLESAPALGLDHTLLERWTRLGIELAQRDIDVALAYFKWSPTAARRLGQADLYTWGRQALDALPGRRSFNWKAVRAYLETAAVDQCAYPLARWQIFLNEASRIAAQSPAAAERFISLGNHACLLLSDEQIHRWVTAGLTDSCTEEELVNYFAGTSLRAIDARDDLITGVTLRDHVNTLALICEALRGVPLQIRASTQLIGHISFTGGALTDGHTIYLPEVVPSFGLLKLMALHQTMLLDGAVPSEVNPETAMRADDAAVHLEADRRLLGHLPGLLAEMRRQADPALPANYPWKSSSRTVPPQPWWGDFRPELLYETRRTVAEVKERAAERYAELPPEVVEKLLAMLLAEGNREGQALWELFREMADNIEFKSPDPEELQESVKTFFYREWDANLSDYKLDWCLIRQRIALDDPNGFVAEVRARLPGIIRLIRRQFMRMKPERFRKYRAQPAGDSLDIDALVQAVVDRKSGRFFSENVYIRRDKRIRDVAVFFLVDLSGSTEEKVEGRRVIDVQKEAMVLMAEALEALGDPFAIYGFSSDGRFRVDLFDVKDFHQPYDQSVQYRLGNLQPLGLTRLGAVIRHAAYKLGAVTAGVKLMIILTDGRPYDLEYGNLDYAVADTHKALQEARRARIHPFIITSDPKSRDYLRRIAPESQSLIVPRVELLPKMLPAVYKRLTL